MASEWAERMKENGWLWDSTADQAGDEGRTCLILAHGAGAPMDSPFMNSIASLIARGGVDILRFEFPYMAQRRLEGGRRPPARRRACWKSGGKSMPWPGPRSRGS